MKLSIIIPTLNEQANIAPLLKRIEKTLGGKTQYEVIFVDDNSTDGTQKVIEKLKTIYPISLHTKIGKKGKAQSLIEGFAYTKYPVLAMIDADLQYPPEAFVEMMQKIHDGSDVVIANRKKQKTHTIRRFTSKSFYYIFGKLLHGFSVDVQSGLKMFRKEIIERVELHSTEWEFDLEFLILARDAGYKIDTVNIDFEKRTAGNSKIGVVHAGIKMASNALKLKGKGSQIIPFSKKTGAQKDNGFHYKGIKFNPQSDLDIQESAFFQVTKKQILVLSVMALILISGLLLNWHTTVVVLIAALTFLYFADLLFNFYLIFRSFAKTPELSVTPEEIEDHKGSWPTYTVFCPLYKEAHVVPQFISAMSNLSYPKDKLQVMILLEEDDTESIEKINAMNLPTYFTVVVVPHSLPKTKPKACNYGLKFATGEYSVIYDAEDIPDPLQLKKVVLAFEKTDRSVACMQCKLNFYNPRQNLLTRIFTAEYSLWFDLVLTGLQSINAPIPLGGTSNHFRTASLHAFKGWDAFNVTEDCDLGIRLVKQGFKTAILDSTTLEEANSDYVNWFWQRTRWIKGYIQTYMVHMRNPKAFVGGLRNSHVVTFQLIVGGKILSMFVNPLMWLITASYFIFRPVLGDFIESFFPGPILYMGVFSLIFGNFLYIYYYMIGCAKREYYDIIKYAFLVPFYWLAMSVAASFALVEFIRKPHKWSKTKHGLHLQNVGAMKQATTAIGRTLVHEEYVHEDPKPIRLPVIARGIDKASLASASSKRLKDFTTFRKNIHEVN